jgi:hypothetical protein
MQGTRCGDDQQVQETAVAACNRLRNPTHLAPLPDAWHSHTATEWLISAAAKITGWTPDKTIDVSVIESILQGQPNQGKH